MLDPAGATHATVERNLIYDHRRGELSIAVGHSSVVADNDTTVTLDTRVTRFLTAGPTNTIEVDSGLVAGDTVRVAGNVLRGAVTVVRAGGYGAVIENTITGSAPTTTGIYLTGQHRGSSATT